MSRQFPSAPPAPSTPLVPPGAAAPSQTLIDRTGTWLERNKNLVILGTAVAVSAGVGYYLYSNSNGSAPSSGGSDGASTSSSKKSKKKKNSKKSKFIPGEGTDGPLLEEIKPTPPAEPKKEPVPEEEDLFSGVPQGEALAAMSETARNELGAKLKDKGNKMYAKKNYEKAVECYSKAIEVSVKRDPVFFSNRAACYNNYKPPQYEKVVEDCNEALALDKTYAKALRRRAGALEHLDRLEEAIRDFTATTVIEAFQDRVSAEGMERALVNLVAKRWGADKEKRENTMPGHSFINQYMSAFRSRDKPAMPENPSQGDRTLDLAFDALSAQDYPHALSFTNEAIEQGVSSKEAQAEAYNLRGTFRFLMNDPKGAAEDLEKSISIHPTSIAWTKLAAVRMELADKVKAFGDFESAIQLNPDDPDVYYHRAQVYFISEEWQQAMKDYEKSIQLDNTFIFAYIQYAMCQYKLGNKAGTYSTFRKILKQFPDRSESYNYYGEVLSEEESYPEAIERFDRAIEIEKSKPKPNVIAMVNKAYTLTKWKQDHEAAIKLCKEAFEVDPAHDVAAATLGHLILRQGQMEEATVWFQKAYELARSEAEALAVLQYLEATKAQLSFLKTYPELAYRLTTPPEGLMQ